MENSCSSHAAWYSITRHQGMHIRQDLDVQRPFALSRVRGGSQRIGNVLLHNVYDGLKNPETPRKLLNSISRFGVVSKVAVVWLLLLLSSEAMRALSGKNAALATGGTSTEAILLRDHQLDPQRQLVDQFDLHGFEEQHSSQGQTRDDVAQAAEHSERKEQETPEDTVNAAREEGSVVHQDAEAEEIVVGQRDRQEHATVDEEESSLLVSVTDNLAAPLEVSLDSSEDREEEHESPAARERQRLEPAVSPMEGGERKSPLLESVFKSEVHIEDEDRLRTPPGLTTHLMPHQEIALAWMQQREAANRVCKLFWDELHLPTFRGYANVITGEEVELADPPLEVQGGILADDMGLGKTITVLALVVSDMKAATKQEEEEEEEERQRSLGEAEDESSDLIRRLENLNLADTPAPAPQLDYFQTHRSEGPTLIVCPLSVLQNWRTQIKLHTNDQLRVLIFHGPTRTRDPELLQEQDIVLSTYPVLASEFSRQSRGDQTSVLHSLRWRRVVLDEGHVICNPKAKQSRAVLQLEAERRWVVTGTPLQNKLDDLFSLFAFLQIHPFKDFDWFRCLISDPARSKLESRREQGLSIVRSILGTYCLRRSKTQKIGGKPILQLPKKQEVVKHLALSGEEQDIYDALFQSGKAMLRTYIKEGTVMSHYTKILERLVRLRQLCCHKQLLPPGELHPANLSASDMEEVKRLEQVLEEKLSSGEEECCVCLEPIERAVITKCAHIFCKECLARCIDQCSDLSLAPPKCPLCRTVISPGDVVERSGVSQAGGQSSTGDDKLYISTKLRAILDEIEHLRKTAPGEKVVIFSQFTSFLDIIESSLAPGSFVKLDGRLTRAKRDHVIESFQNDEQLEILLISMKAGGTGLNLVVANHVFITDLWWNSAVEKQAMDRVYRLGQTRDVRVVKFVITGTIEERILELQHKKEQLIEGAMSVSSKGELQRVRTQDLNFLFR